MNIFSFEYSRYRASAQDALTYIEVVLHRISSFFDDMSGIQFSSVAEDTFPLRIARPGTCRSTILAIVTVLLSASRISL
jgi:hypothetical protein